MRKTDFLIEPLCVLFPLTPDAMRIFSPDALCGKLHCAAPSSLSSGAYDISCHARTMNGQRIFVRERGNVERSAAGGARSIFSDVHAAGENSLALFRGSAAKLCETF
ncbi:MAG: hypothetical protein IJF15_03540 [Oscillospiraceae bacterium]|nr:hypothetical protein [Oscillospiraceae bacterium]